MRTKFFSFLFLIALLSSCSFLIGKIDTTVVDQKDYLKNIPETPTFCPLESKPRLQLINTNAHSQQVYLEMIEKLPGLDFLDHLALWTLLQQSVRPDQSSPTSRFQILLRQNGESQYLDFFSETKEDQLPLLFGLDWIIKRFKKKTSLEYYARLLDTQAPKIRVGKNLEGFLQANVAKIKEDQELAPYFVRGTEPLKENERVPRLSYLDVVKHYRSRENNQKVIVNTSLTGFVTASGHRGSCNYDFNLYDNSIFLIDKVIPVANLFGLSLDAKAFMATTSQKIDEIRPVHNFPLFYGESKVRSSAVCVIENQQELIWTFSNFSRDPGQHLFHLIRYGLTRSKSTPEVDRLIRHSRHLFLSDPIRLVIESNRSRSDQIENLLKLNLPIYNAEKLGNIWAFTEFSGEQRFIIDDRNVGAFTCK
jgi:hypothetical protein